MFFFFKKKKDNDNTSDITTGNSTSSFTKAVSKNRKAAKSSINNFLLVRSITTKERPKFEWLLLRMTISNGWSFHWTSDPATLEFYEFLNPNLTLPRRHALSMLKKEIWTCPMNKNYKAIKLVLL